jgi:hypothetical protein
MMASRGGRTSDGCLSGSVLVKAGRGARRPGAALRSPLLLPLPTKGKGCCFLVTALLCCVVLCVVLWWEGRQASVRTRRIDRRCRGTARSWLGKREGKKGQRHGLRQV